MAGRPQQKACEQQERHQHLRSLLCGSAPRTPPVGSARAGVPAHRPAMMASCIQDVAGEHPIGKGGNSDGVSPTPSRHTYYPPRPRLKPALGTHRVPPDSTSGAPGKSALLAFPEMGILNSETEHA